MLFKILYTIGNGISPYDLQGSSLSYNTPMNGSQ